VMSKAVSALTKFAAAGALSVCSAVSALAGSYTQPGSTIGPLAGARDGRVAGSLFSHGAMQVG